LLLVGLLVAQMAVEVEALAVCYQGQLLLILVLLTQ
jgi:hypothetical protein